MIELKTNEFWKATIALGIASFFIFANVYFTQPLLPVFSQEFSISPVTSSLSLSLVLLTLGFSFFFYSALAEVVSRKRIMVTVMVIATAVTFAIAFAPTFEVLLLLRIIQAFVLAGIPTIAMAYIGEEFAVKALTIAIGIHISANTIGGMGGRLISGIVTDLVDWRMAFIMMGLISGLCLFLFLFLLPASKHFKKREFNLRSTITDYRRHLQNKTITLALVIGGLHFLVFIGLFSFVTYYLSAKPFNVSTTVLGFLFMTYVAGTFSSTLAGRVSQYLKQTVCMGIGIVIMVLGMGITLIPHLYAVILGLLFLAFGFFFAHSCSSAWVTRQASFSKASASGLYLSSYYLGGGIGSVYLGVFWNQAGWIGVLLGAILVMILTSYCTFHLYKIEKSQLQTEGLPPKALEA